MAKTYISHSKYIIHQRFDIKGVVDKHDIIGAIFGQSEGIIGEDLDIRELQSSGKIGRIETELVSKNGITTGTLTIPSGSDMVETSILAATIEVVDKVGPCDAKFETIKIEDTRIKKRQLIVSRAKELLSRLISDEIPDSQEIANEVRAEVRSSELQEYGPDRLSAGPMINDSEEIIIVEGRADVINLLKYNIRNVIGMGGSKIPQSICDLAKRKTTIAFIDGDRGGELDLKRLLQIAEIDYIARAPPGKEVEELTKKEILASLSKKIPVIQTKSGEKIIGDEQLELGSEHYWQVEDDKDDANNDDLTKSNYGKSIAKPDFTKPEAKRTVADSYADKQHNNINAYSHNNNMNANNQNNYTNRYNKPYNQNITHNQTSHGQNANYNAGVSYGSNQNQYKGQFNKNKGYENKYDKPFDKPVINKLEKSFDKPVDNLDLYKPNQVLNKVVAENLTEKIMDKPTHIVKHELQESKMEAYPDLKLDYKSVMNELKGSLKAKVFDDNGKPLNEFVVRDIIKELKDKKPAPIIVFDGIISKRLAELAKSKGTKYLIGSKKGKMSKIKGIELIEFTP